MSRRLFVVEDTFFIKGRGLVPVPGIVPQGDERFRVGDSILLKRPDGPCLESAISGIEMIHGTVPRPKGEVVILLKDLTKEDVPIGCEVWSTAP
jgi:translation elongation factor EF-Tu-like GTPase